MIVEDDLSLQRLYEMMLKSSGHKVLDKANNGQEAIILYKRYSDCLDIVLMDNRMPILSGVEAAKEILKMDSNAKIIFISADSHIKRLALEIGAICFLKKPFSLENLENLIKEIEKAL